MSDEIDALEEVAETNSRRPNVGSSRTKRDTGNWRKALAKGQATRSRLKAQQTKHLKFHKREGV